MRIHKKKCEKAYTSQCDGKQCSIGGTPRCVEGVPIDGKCNKAYTKECNKGLCALFGTSE